MSDDDERWRAHFDRPLWQSLPLTDGDPFGGLFGPKPGQRGPVVCLLCGVRVEDRGLHYRFHVQISMVLSSVAGLRTVVHTITSEDEDSGALIERMVGGVLTDTRAVEED